MDITKMLKELLLGSGTRLCAKCSKPTPKKGLKQGKCAGCR